MKLGIAGRSTGARTARALPVLDRFTATLVTPHLRNDGSLEGRHHPPPVALDPGAGEQRPPIKGFALRVASSGAVDPRYDRGVAVDPHAWLEELDRFDHTLVG